MLTIHDNAMPCRDDYPEEDARERRELQSRLDAMAQMLCACCRELETVQGLAIPAIAKDWWGEHKVHDEERRRIEKLRTELHAAEKRAAEIRRELKYPSPIA